jgi:hypothetical protein
MDEIVGVIMIAVSIVALVGGCVLVLLRGRP